MKRAWRRLKVRLGRDGRAILRLHDSLDGLLFVEESAWLYRAAGDRARIVEIGSFRGKSAVMLAKGSAGVGGRLLCIDPHINAIGTEKTRFSRSDHDVFVATITRHAVADRVTKWTKTSAEAAAVYDGQPIDLLWIDGDHSYRGIKSDLSMWKRYVRVGGMVAAHDYSHEEAIRRAWDEEITQDGGFAPMTLVRSIASAIRVG